MKKHLIFVGTIIITAILLWSCHLDDFDLKKLAVAKDIKPVGYTPLAYGTFKVGDHFGTTSADNDTIKIAEIDLNTINFDKSGVVFSSNAIDSVYLVVDFSNGTPMKMQVQFDFINTQTGSVYGKTFDSGLIQAGKMDATGKVIESVTTRVEFPMDSNDMNYITLATGIEFNVKLLQPDAGSVIVKNLKESLFKVQIAMRAPLSLWKLN